MQYWDVDLYKLIGSTDLDYFMGFEIKPPSSHHDGGIWIKEIPPASRRFCSPRELQAWCDPYPYQLREPIITFPCTEAQLAFFLHVTGEDHFLVNDGSSLSNCIGQLREDIDKKIGASPGIINAEGRTLEEKQRVQGINQKRHDRYLVKLRGYVGNIEAQEQTAAGKQNAEPVPTETDTQLCDRLQAQGLDDKAIAKELKRVFPGTLPSRIGRFLPANPGANITSDAHSKRGRRLLK